MTTLRDMIDFQPDGWLINRLRNNVNGTMLRNRSPIPLGRRSCMGLLQILCAYGGVTCIKYEAIHAYISALCKHNDWTYRKTRIAGYLER